MGGGFKAANRRNFSLTYAGAPDHRHAQLRYAHPTDLDLVGGPAAGQREFVERVSPPTMADSLPRMDGTAPGPFPVWGIRMTRQVTAAELTVGDRMQTRDGEWVSVTRVSRPPTLGGMDAVVLKYRLPEVESDLQLRLFPDDMVVVERPAA